jgi:glycerol-1-phosphate dehydrogenase [NAD(P)+]
MGEERIRAALAEATDTAEVAIGSGALASVAEVVEGGAGDRPVQVVADATTWEVAGAAVQRRLEAAGRATQAPYRFPPGALVTATYDNVERVRDALAAHHAVPVAVGSGSLNDIVKRAAAETGRPYVVVATAASMDGYTAFGAAITRDGYKQTMTCPAPRAVVADLEVLAGAPPAMTASGFGDLLGKVTAGADWLVADALGAEPVDPTAWELAQGSLREAIGHPAELAGGDRDALGRLVEGLVLSGLAMQAHASSRPASGAEHQFSHLWEMEGLGHDRRPPLSHGFKVGVGTVAIAALYERLLDRDLADLDIKGLRRAWPGPEQAEAAVRAAHTTPGLDEAAVAETLAKHADPAALARRLAVLADRWPLLRDRLRAQLLPAARLRELLAAAGAPTRPAELELTAEAFRDTYRRARMIRRRYTVLDLAAETGTLDELVDELFAPGGSFAG